MISTNFDQLHLENVYEYFTSITSTNSTRSPSQLHDFDQLYLENVFECQLEHVYELYEFVQYWLDTTLVPR